MTRTVLEYLILIEILTILFLRFLLSFSFDWEDTSNTQDSVWPHSKNLEVRQKYSAARGIFNSLLRVWKCGESHGLSCLIYYLPLYRWPV